MSYTNQFLEDNQDSINEEWYKYCHEIQEVRRKYGMPDLVFTQGDKDYFIDCYNKATLVDFIK